jgi:L-2-hydroxyglutarate oxidase
VLPERADVAVIGAGILGLATAVELRGRRPDWTVVVLEKERAPALHQTGRNSGVIHSGVYYAPGSLKARLCTRGRELLLEFCEREGVPYEVCGKVIVAADESELPALHELHRRSVANGVPVELIDSARLRELEPHCAGVAALHVPGTGLVDYRLVAEALAGKLDGNGGGLVLDTEVTGIAEGPRGVRLTTSRGELEVAHAVSCAGLQADRVSGKSVGDTAIVPFRGDYFALRPEARRLCRNLIYPVPDPRFPFLGVHVNRRHDGEVWAGPNAVVAFAREGYRRRDVNLRDAWETLSAGPFWRLVRRYWRLGLVELYRDLSRHAYAAQARRYLPELTAADLLPAPAGIRAQALARDGSLVDDFLFVESARVVHVQNAPSPAATSSLAIGAHIADRALELFAKPS